MKCRLKEGHDFFTQVGGVSHKVAGGTVVDLSPERFAAHREKFEVAEEDESVRSELRTMVPPDDVAAVSSDDDADDFNGEDDLDDPADHGEFDDFDED